MVNVTARYVMLQSVKTQEFADQELFPIPSHSGWKTTAASAFSSVTLSLDGIPNVWCTVLTSASASVKSLWVQNPTYTCKSRQGKSRNAQQLTMEKKSAIHKMTQKSILTIGPRSWQRVVARVQLWASRVTIWWRIRISIRFGRFGILNWDIWLVWPVWECNFGIPANLESPQILASHDLVSGVCMPSYGLDLDFAKSNFVQTH